MSKPIEWYTERYTDRGITLTSTDPVRAALGDWQALVVHRPDWFGLIVAELKFDAAELHAAPCIERPDGSHVYLFRKLPGSDAADKCLKWPTEENPGARVPVFELKATDEVELPPSLGKWIRQPAASFEAWPMLPLWLSAVWLAWDEFRRDMVEACPWINQPAETAPKQPPARLNADIHTPLPFANDKGTPLKHISNLAEICRRLGVVVRYNVIKKEEELIIPGEGFSLDNEANASIAWLASECSLFKFPTDKLGEFLTYLADRNLYNPVAEWITSRPWDGTDRLQALYDTVTSSGDRGLKETLMRRWLVSACAAAFNPAGVSAHGVLTFQGEQYIGKTKWFKGLVPGELGLVKDGMLLRPDDKDSVKQVCSFWLVELGELDATFRKSDIAALKSFITNDSDVLRRPYSRKESHYARRTVFFASVNPHKFLHDPTGNRRFWTIPVTALDHDHGIDMQQLWAQVAELYKAGESIYLTPEEMALLNDQNEGHTVLDPVEELISTRLRWDDAPVLWRWVTATDLMHELGYERPTASDSTRCAMLVRKREGVQTKRSNGKNLLMVPKLCERT